MGRTGRPGPPGPSGAKGNAGFHFLRKLVPLNATFLNVVGLLLRFY